MQPTVTDQVAWSVGRSVSPCVTLVSPATTAELIEMLFGLGTQVGPRNHVLDGNPDAPYERVIFRRERSSSLSSKGTLCCVLCKIG